MGASCLCLFPDGRYGVYVFDDGRMPSKGKRLYTFEGHSGLWEITRVVKARREIADGARVEATVWVCPHPVWSGT